MAKPNKTAARFYARQGRDPRVSESIAKMHAESPMVVDMGKFQRGEMTAEEFRAKWDPNDLSEG